MQLVIYYLDAQEYITILLHFYANQCLGTKGFHNLKRLFSNFETGF